MNLSKNYFGQHLFSQLISLCNKSILSLVIAELRLYHCYKPVVSISKSTMNPENRLGKPQTAIKGVGY